MNVGANLHGFCLKRIRELPEIQGHIWELEHEKTGAQVCWLNREDENKTFSIAFKTLPEDSTGVFHILEHSVLCGSDRYPVKEPFVELLKSSVQTFLNAMTYADKTVYPVSSRNDQDFLNLIDIYLDAVLHPAIYHRPEIFRQEGWHYEFGEEIQYQGVVFSEMTGAYGSPDTVLESEMNRLLFPDNCYCHDSGGDPVHIPDLTYERFIAAHQKYYHPSNARISLVGSVNLDAVLAKLDANLQGFGRRNMHLAIPMQKPLRAVMREIPYEVTGDTPLSERGIVAHGVLLGSYAEQERNYAAAVLADYLAGDTDAPLKRAILQNGLGQDVTIAVHDGQQQSWISWEIWNTDVDKLPAIRRTIRSTLEELLNRGLEPERLEASLNHFAFKLRDRDNSGVPRSLKEALDMLDTWLYGGDPAQALLVEQPLASLRAKLCTEYFPNLIRELFLREECGATVALRPSRDLSREKAALRARRIACESSAWTPERRGELQRQAAELALWQQTPDSAEALATIPVLTLADLKEKPAPLHMTVTRRGKIPVLRHITGSSIVHLHTYFDASDLSLEDLPALSMLTRVLGKMGTRCHSSEEIQMQVKQKIGALSFRTNVIPGQDTDHCRVQVVAYMACLPHEAVCAGALLTEILNETDFADRRLLRELLNQAAMETQMTLPANGHLYANTRMSAYESAHGAAREYSGGTEFVLWLKKSCTAEDAVLDELLVSLKEIAQRIFTTERLTVSCSENGTDALLDTLTFAERGTLPDEANYPPLGKRQEGLVIPSGVGFIGKGTNFKRHGRTYSGSIPVLTNILNFTFLWNEIRVQGGAYGCGFLGRDDGDVSFYTYRDPQPGRSLQVIGRAAEFIRSFCAGAPDLTGYILSAVSTLDPLLSAQGKMMLAEARYFKGTTYADICRYYSQLLHTTVEDLLRLCSMLDDIAADHAACVVAGQSLIDECGHEITTHQVI